MTQQRISLNKCPNNTAQNLPVVSQFHLMSLSEDPELQPILFGLFLFTYMVTVLGNLLIILAVTSDSHLHTPMYFFLSNLSWSDICFISTTVPKMIWDIQTQSRVISYVGCLTQMSMFIIFGCMDSILLTAMAYDRFVAICHPLHYTTIMNPHLCAFLVLVSVLVSLLDSQVHNLIVLQFTYFNDMQISNFFCDPSQLLNLDCSEMFTRNIVTHFIGVFFGLFSTSGILLSYYKIISTIQRVPSTSGKYKAFSTCGSHLSVVCLFYGTAIGVYVGSTVSNSPENCAVASLMYTVVTPMLNPFIYSLRNKDIKSALWRFQKRTM
ncbi:putative gustatory receptor clone PTE01 isoform X1 [Cricetulus griseus]|uniref:Olfactory receptor n=2 Tax=Cricetulus griseus TaxID=10029 RepID=A0A8C2MSN4_CRIGR|nr:putative gustatory receptor clone PTE01 isoform X1 [Cricetulus griseus]XP_027267456.1 putative gustatory receptor clone PTE01 isoform X1 [Cricetulus griseus]